ncbi:helix-turn-helix domain-containing protein [Pseudobacillus badius]|uniref:helix-turn-helix domain-containing protein n=1 Tax=Bacillus badius TaxID=1455 RepID=UPI0024A0B30D|nr:AraC family transcriptional regulator [Bacillus badius]GLY09890.1 putative HTH-type transcriptional regulator YbfP [Bacillus badius]
MNYQPVLQETIRFIEDHLTDELTAAQIADYAGFSLYHFHRVFQTGTGMTAAEYIRNRRLARAAAVLRCTDEPIINIALDFQFGTQESFTRAFKKQYQLPPGQYRKLIGTILTEKGGEQMENQQEVKGWFLSGSHPFNYKIGVDTNVVHQGNRSGYLKSATVQSGEEFATMMQQFKADKFLGKRVKLSAYMKTERVEHFAGLWMRIDNAAGDVLQFDNMSNRPITGNTNWNLYSIVLDVPETSSVISFGVILSNTGHVWMDSFKFAEVDRNVPTTNLEVTAQLLEEPVNLSFEDGLFTKEEA